MSQPNGYGSSTADTPAIVTPTAEPLDAPPSTSKPPTTPNPAPPIDPAPTPIRYPPFPPVPPGASILPYALFKEHGIRIFGLDFFADGAPAPSAASASVGDTGDMGDTGDAHVGDAHVGVGDVEVDGLGIPTVPLRVRHDTDECKTQTRGKASGSKKKRRRFGVHNDDDQDEDPPENETNEEKSAREHREKERREKEELMRLDPVLRAAEMKRRRLVMFAKKEWFELWREGEDLRGKVYDSSLSPVDRIHLASTEFRTGRIWPPAYTIRLGYLWDQYRLFVGLLGEPPVWYRTDLEQNPEDALDDDDEDEDIFERQAPTTPAPKQNQKQKPDLPSSYSDSESDKDPDEPQATSASAPSPPPPKRKHIPARPPYALHDLPPIALSSPTQVRTLLHIASLRRHAKLLAFLSSPDLQTRIFLSWYIRHQGLVFSPAYLAALPRLVCFWMEYVGRTRAMREGERSGEVRRAIEVARRAVGECPATGRLCRLLPDCVGAGFVGMWGVRWLEEPVRFVFDEAEREEAVRRFEEELKMENVQVLEADEVGPVKEDAVRRFEEELETENGQVVEADKLKEDADAGIGIEIMSPTTPAFVEPDTPDPYFQGFSEKQEAEAEATPRAEKVAPKPEPEPTPEPEPDYVSPGPMPVRWDTIDPPSSSPNDPPNTSHEPDTNADTDAEALLAAWAPRKVQPLMAVMGMSTVVLKMKPGLAERSTRRVRGVVWPVGYTPSAGSTTTAGAGAGAGGGSSAGSGVDAGEQALLDGTGMQGRRWKSVQEDLVERFARVVLDPWVGFDDGGCAEAYMVPRVQYTDAGGASASASAYTAASTATSTATPPVAEASTAPPTADTHDPVKDVITLLMDPKVAELLSVGMGLCGTWVQILRKSNEEREPASFSEVGGARGARGGGRGGGRGRGRGRGRGGGGRGAAAAAAGGAQAEETQNVPGTVEDAEPKQAAPSEVKDGSSPPTDTAPAPAPAPTRGGRGGGRGRGRGRGGGPNHHQHGPQKDVNFWYVEELFMAVPSFWTVGEVDEPLRMPEEGEEVEVDEEDMLDDLGDD